MCQSSVSFICLHQGFTRKTARFAYRPLKKEKKKDKEKKDTGQSLSSLPGSSKVCQSSVSFICLHQGFTGKTARFAYRPIKKRKKTKKTLDSVSFFYV